jgi:hypothetical protein
MYYGKKNKKCPAIDKQTGKHHHHENCSSECSCFKTLPVKCHAEN